MAKVGGFGMFVLLAGIGLATSTGLTGLSVEEGMQKINGYIDAGVASIGSSFKVGKKDAGGEAAKPPPNAFIGTMTEIEADMSNDYEKLAAAYPDMFITREGK